jgi:glycosyltransferase involved in cell wall biosynthesis
MVVISSFARSHADRLAFQLVRHQALKRVYTSYPRGFASVPREQMRIVPGLFPMGYVVEKFFPAFAGQTIATLSKLYDRAVARSLLASHNWNARVLHAWEACSLSTLRAAHRMRLVTFLESSCPHPGPRSKLLREEAERVGAKWAPEPTWEPRILRELELTDFVVVPSTYTYNSFVGEGFPREKLVKVPLGVDLNEAPSTIPPKPARFTVLMVGTDPLRKGAYDLLNAWRLLRIPGATLIIRSGVPSKARELAQSLGVECLPPVKRADLLALYRRATVFCFPSVDDGFGLVVLEAMAHGLPVIVTQNVGAADLVREGVDGFVVPIRDAEALAQRIEFFYRDRDIAETFGRNARQRAEAYSWDRYGETILDAYRAACNTSTRGSRDARRMHT